MNFIYGVLFSALIALIIFLVKRMIPMTTKVAWDYAIPRYLSIKVEKRDINNNGQKKLVTILTYYNKKYLLKYNNDTGKLTIQEIRPTN